MSIDSKLLAILHINCKVCNIEKLRDQLDAGKRRINGVRRGCCRSVEISF